MGADWNSQKYSVYSFASAYNLSDFDREGDPLTTVEISNIVDTLYLYKDDGDGVFEADNDSKLAFLKTFSLDPGVVSQLDANADGKKDAADVIWLLLN
ncbi:hypothetical protein JW926_12475 [Candidatus Sumerlaeota bacterium]|nr:hypothetical protein [Candidatus Sumerlaeota bacterium]